MIKFVKVVSLVLVIFILVSSACYATSGSSSDSDLTNERLEEAQMTTKHTQGIPTIGMPETYVDNGSSKAMSTSVHLGAGRHIVWTLTPFHSSINGVAIYDNNDKIIEITGTLSGTTFYTVPNDGAHYITIKDTFGLVLASCTG